MKQSSCDNTEPYTWFLTLAGSSDLLPVEQTRAHSKRVFLKKRETIQAKSVSIACLMNQEFGICWISDKYTTTLLYDFYTMLLSRLCISKVLYSRYT